MPTDSQTLYFHLGMATDDDGVVEAWSVLKTTGSAEDNLRVLASKGFIRILNEDLVSYIMDWDEHNEIRADRLVPSQYRELLIQMVPEVKLKEPKRRADLKPIVPELPGRPVDNQRTAEDRLGKDRIISAVATAPRIELVEVKLNSQGEEVVPTVKEGNKDYDELCEWLRNLTGVRIVNIAKQRAFLKKAKAAGITRAELKARAEELIGKPFYQENGLDWGGVVSSFDRKA